MAPLRLVVASAGAEGREETKEIERFRPAKGPAFMQGDKRIVKLLQCQYIIADILLHRIMFQNGAERGSEETQSTPQSGRQQ